ncbi:hypothetical protein COB52_00050 [Candidatus Kaiserbacteria bacterium]|nr:MAG: hypothetical protein COB52_00050 [Candidatus Kaiserbacteria bacterium]
MEIYWSGGAQHRPPALDLHVAADLSDKAYGGFEEDDNAVSFEDMGYHQVELFGWGEAGAQAFIAVGDHHAVLAFRGTQVDKIEDIITDLRANLVSFGPAGRVHHGFSLALESLWSDIVRFIGSLLPQKFPIHVTGHSMGAAMGILAAARLKQIDRPPASVVTIGCPRVGTADLVRYLRDVPIYRVVRCADVVARRPELLCLAGYRHVGDLRYIDRFDEVRRAPSMFDRIYDRVMARIKTLSPVLLGNDHHSRQDYARILLDCWMKA